MPALPLGFTYDNALLLHDGAAALTADGAGQVSSAGKILDLGAGVFIGAMVVDVSAIDVATTDEIYQLLLQGSTVANMSTDKVNLAARIIGANAAILADEDETTGRYIIPFVNIDRLGEVQRYVRFYLDGTGTNFSLTCKAYLVKFPGSD